MIIKSKRTKAKGAALKRLLRHVMDGEDNDLVELVQGNVADLEDARADALRFGREYSVRHWILSPELDITPQQLAYLLALLAVEFGFEPERAVVWKHRKPRAVENDCDHFAVENACDHFHVLVPEVDAITGSVLSSSHNFKRHEKLARQVEVVWGHRLTRGAHNRAVASALAGGENANVVTAMTDAGLLDAPKPIESFPTGEHQRAKREGLDLPQLRVMISEALSASQSQTDFAKKLAAIGLRIRTGEKADTPVVETVDRVLVGSLARLTRLRKAALLERLKFNVGDQYAIEAETDHSSSNIPATQKASAGNGTRREAGGVVRSSGAASPHDGRDRTPTAVDGRHGADPKPAGSAGSPAGRSDPCESNEGRRSHIAFTLGCTANQGALLDLLSIARRSALNPLERVVADLDDSIEQNSSLANRTFVFPEPSTLVLTRKNAKETQHRLHSLESEADGTLQQLSALPPSTAWRRFWFRREAKNRKELNDKLSTQLASVQRAARDHELSKNRLAAEVKSSQVARVKCEVEHERTVQKAKQEILIASTAKTFVRQNPHTATWGSLRLLEVAMQIEKIRSERLSEDRVDVDEASYLFPADGDTRSSPVAY